MLVSDGDWNEGPPPVQAAARLRLKGVPVFAVPVGSPTRLPDVELLSLDAPTFGVAGKSVRIPFTIESSLPREYVTTVTLRTSDGDEVTKEVRIAADGPHQRLRCVWKPKATGDFTLTLDVPKHADETLDRQQPADRADRDPRGEAAGAGRRVVPALGVPLPAECPVARSGRRGLVPAVPPGAEQGRRRQQGLHQAVPGRARRALEVRRGVPGRRGRRRRPADGRAVPAAQGAGRAPGERPGLHAGVAGAASSRCSTPSSATSARSCSTRRSRAAGARARPAISS